MHPLKLLSEDINQAICSKDIQVIGELETEMFKLAHQVQAARKAISRHPFPAHDLDDYPWNAPQHTTD